MNGDISRAEFRPFGEREANEQRERGNKDRMTEQMSNRFMDGAGNDGNALFFISASSNDGGREGREGRERREWWEGRGVRIRCLCCLRVCPFSGVQTVSLRT